MACWDEACLGDRWLGGDEACWVARVRSLACPGLLGGEAGRRTPCAGRAVMLTAVQSLRLAEGI
jgi:hypothetical protein